MTKKMFYKQKTKLKMAAILSVGTGAGYHYIVHFYIFLFHSGIYTTHKHNIHLLYFIQNGAQFI